MFTSFVGPRAVIVQYDNASARIHIVREDDSRETPVAGLRLDELTLSADERIIDILDATDDRFVVAVGGPATEGSWRLVRYWL